ncbi:MAG: LPS export ABC transporter permease LptG [Syntrophobacteraceae bacterium]|jgi:lipopolysaccharide export system permease protein
MKIIPRYVLQHFLPIFSLAITGFVGIYLSVDFFQRVDIMLGANLPLRDIYTFFLREIPMILTRGIPMATIISAIIALGLLKRNRELIAMETAGVNPSYFVAPIAVAALLLSVIHFGVAEFVARPLKQKLDETWLVNVRHWKSVPGMDMENLWYREENTIYQIRLYDREKNVMQIASIFFLDPNFRIIQRVDARRITWTDQGWVAEDGLIIGFHDGNTDQQWFDRKRLDLNVTPKDFIAGLTVPDKLSIAGLHRYVEKIEGEGFSATPYRVDLHLRIASPFATLILALLGILVALRQGIHGGIAAGVGTSLAVAFAFYVVSNVGSSLASAGTLPPSLGVWAGNIIFAALICYAWIRRWA